MVMPAPSFMVLLFSLSVFHPCFIRGSILFLPPSPSASVALLRGDHDMGSRLSILLALLAGLLALALVERPAEAYVEARYTLARIVHESTNIVLVKVDKVNKERKLIYYKKVADLKGLHPTDDIRHNVGVGGFNAAEQKAPIEWAEVGKLAIFFHNGGASETCIGKYWYQCYAGGAWWNHSHGEPYLARSYCGDIDGLKAAVEKLLKKEAVIVPGA